MSDTIAERARKIVEHYGGKWRGRFGMCRCPAHADRRPSLSVRVGDRAVLYTCWAGCSRESIARAIAAEGYGAQDLAQSPGHELKNERDDRLREVAQWLYLKTMALPGTLADRYLTGRGLEATRSGALRFAPLARFGKGADQLIRPAMVAAVHDDDGIAAVQRTIIDPVTARKSQEFEDPRRMLGQPGRGAVRLQRATTILGIAEGVETALASSRELGIPVWASLGTKRFDGLQLPRAIGELVLLADDDRPGHEAVERARSAYARPGLAITTAWPGKGRTDWNDVVQQTATASG